MYEVKVKCSNGEVHRRNTGSRVKAGLIGRELLKELGEVNVESISILCGYNDTKEVCTQFSLNMEAHRWSWV